MKILLAGATGFVGRCLVPKLLQERYELVVVGRTLAKIVAAFGQRVHAVTWEQLDSLSAGEFDAVINLSGENIAQGRWTAARKASILQSRVTATNKLVDFCLKSTGPRPHLYNTSAIGIYGTQASECMTEAAVIKPAQDFLAQVAQAWEQAAQRGAQQGLAVTLMRFGVVLKSGEGMLKPVVPSFRLGMGSVLGSGEQFLSWIESDDLVSAILFLLQHPEITGPVNLCAPAAIKQAVFAKTLAELVHRPLWLTMPAWFIQFAFGDMGQELLLGSQQVYPERLLANGFVFAYPNIQDALMHALRRAG